MSIPKNPASELVLYDMAAPLQMLHTRPTAEQLVHWNKIVSAKEGEILLEEPYIINMATGDRLAGQIPEDVSVALVVIRATRAPD